MEQWSSRRAGSIVLFMYAVLWAQSTSHEIPVHLPSRGSAYSLRNSLSDITAQLRDDCNSSHFRSYRSNKRHLFQDETRKCQEGSCNISASFGFADEGKRLACGRHRSNGMVNLKARPCAHPEGCTIRPRFGPAGGRPTFCLNHRRPGNVLLSNRHASEDKAQWRRKCTLSTECSKTASFGMPGDGHPRSCTKHRSVGTSSKERKHEMV